jgi:hypothetical protein
MHRERRIGCRLRIFDLYGRYIVSRIKVLMGQVGAFVEDLLNSGYRILSVGYEGACTSNFLVGVGWAGG